jgi:hypothetical protein
MQSTGKRILLGIMAIVAVAGVIVWFLYSHSIPEFNAKPVPKNAPTLNEADIEKVLGVEQFRVVRRVRQVPIAVKESFSNFTELPFDLANPGEQISSDSIIRGKSSRRLVFLGLSEDSAVLVYEQGGFVGTCATVIFWFGDGGRGWGATLDYGPIPKDISSLKAVVQRGQFHTWERRG